MQQPIARVFVLSTCIAVVAACTPMTSPGDATAETGVDVSTADSTDAADVARMDTPPVDATDTGAAIDTMSVDAADAPSDDSPATDDVIADASPSDVATMDDVIADAPPSDATPDASDAATVADASDAAATCTSASTFVFAGVVTDVVTHMPIADAAIQFVPCDGTRVVSDSAGAFSTAVPAGLAGYPRIDAAGHLSAMGQELVAIGDETGTPVQAIPSSLAALGLPGFDATTATISIDNIEVAPGASGSCAAIDGVTFTVAGHPEAQVAYYTGTPPTPVPTATTSAGKAVISHLAPASAGEFVTVVGSKAGCHLTVVYTRGTAAYTGRTPIAVGALSIAHPQIGN